VPFFDLRILKPLFRRLVGSRSNFGDEENKIYYIFKGCFNSFFDLFWWATGTLGYVYQAFGIAA
jgi:hypothetical protein